MKTFFIFFSVLFLNTINAQVIKVLDKNTLEPIPYVTVLFIKGDKPVHGDFTTEQGDIKIEKSFDFDSFSFSSIGYENADVKKLAITDNKVLLNAKSIKLKEIVVSASKKSTPILGEFEGKRKKYISVNRENQFASYFENRDHQKLMLKSFLFKVSKVKDKTVLRIHVYRKMEYNKIIHPDIAIQEKDIVKILEPGTKGVVEVNLAEYAIEMPDDGVFIGIEGLASYDKSGNPYSDIDELTQIEAHQSESETYCVKYKILNDVWININEWLKRDYPLTFKKEINKNMLFVPSFGLKVLLIE